MIENNHEVSVIRTNRKKSASISIENKVVKVRVPKWLSDGKIKELLKKKPNG
jgi:predicted metal-dependent hydrolase